MVLALKNDFLAKISSEIHGDVQKFSVFSHSILIASLRINQSKFCLLKAIYRSF